MTTATFTATNAPSDKASLFTRLVAGFNSQKTSTWADGARGL